MKTIQIIIFTFFIIYIQNKCDIDYGINKPSDCHSRELSSTEKQHNKYCCYLYYTHDGKESKECSCTSQEEYDKIDDTIKQYEEFFGIKIKSLDCKSTYLQLGLFSLLFIIF